MFRQHYYEALDLIIACIVNRFQQPGYEIYKNLEQLLLKTAEEEDASTEFQFVCQFYKDDLEPEVLRVQLVTFILEFKRTQTSSVKVDIFDIRNYFCSLTTAQRLLLSQVCILVKLILVMPATNSTSERSFSTLRRVKTYLRNSMTQQRLNHLMLLHIHKDITDTMNLTEVASEFVRDSPHRARLFGKFTS